MDRSGRGNLRDKVNLISHGVGGHKESLREAIKKKKTTKFWTLSEKGGGSAPQPNFLSMKSMDMCIEGGGGLELLVQTCFS